ncbi:MAG: hypothetical protein JWL81_2905 [Verrucomicrobiales bacterium]|nr:hypothetical protein [Verrucomicrobiales bacterium]
MYERSQHRLLKPLEFLRRVLKHGLVALAMVAVALGIGVAGYHWIGKFSWVDSLLNASMILGGMGPVNPLDNDGAKIFASVYALFSGLAFIGVATVLIAPFIHRLMHRFHLDEDDGPEDSREDGDGRASRRRRR